MIEHSPKVTRRGFLAGAVAVTVSAAAQKSPHPFSLDSRLRGEFTLASVGDLIITNPVRATIARNSPKLLELLHNADGVFGNFEDTAIDLDRFHGYPEGLSGGGWLLSTPSVPADVKAMGFDIVSRANNHATDWSVQGMLETDQRLDDAGLVHAGTGRTLTAARAPAYWNGPRARLALVAAAAHFTPMEPAMDALGRVGARPGISPLHLNLIVRVPVEQFEQLRALQAMQPADSYTPDKDADTVTLFGTKYRKSDSFALHYTIESEDEQAILRNIRQAKEVSDLTMFSLHVHEPGNWSETPPDCLQHFAHELIDGGADAFFGHGPHQLRGIEIYKGKPIFYSLGNFCFMEDEVEVVVPAQYALSKTTPEQQTPAELMEKRRAGEFDNPAFLESIVAVSTFRDGTLAEIALHPIDLGLDGPNGERGIPQLASPATAQRILTRLQRLSEPYGTKIVISDNIGTIRVS